MNTDFQPIPVFNEGAPISAADINALLKNNLIASNVLNSPQPLFMDSHAYAPKALPLSWRSPEFDIWKGSFMYREGMRNAYLGFHIKLDSGIYDVTQEYAASQFTDVSIAVIVKHTSQSYKTIYTTASLSKFCAAVKLSQLGQTTVTSTGGNYTFTIRNGHWSGSEENILGDQVITRDSRMSTITINLSPLGLQDGEIVEVKLVIVSNDNPTVSPNLGQGYTTLFNKFFYKSRFSGRDIATSHIFYSMLYAKVDGDLSYSSNWPSTTFTTTGNNILSPSNLSILTEKQSYITERLRNRPMPATGSIVYLSAWGGTASMKLLEQDIVPGEWSYYQSNYWTPINNEGTKLTEAEDIPKVLDMNRSFNTQSNLVTYSWSPYFDVYDVLYLNFRFYGNTQARQVLIVDLPDQPVSQTSTRRSILRWPNAAGRPSNHITGNYKGQDLYGSIFAYHETVSTVYNSNARKTYLNKMFNIRIPSPTTPVFSPEFQKNSLEHNAPYSKFYLTRGLWEDSVPIYFTKTAQSGSQEKWGLVKAAGDNETIQYGFVGDASAADAVGDFQNKIVVSNVQTERDVQYIRNINYNNANYKWTFKNKSKGYSQVYVNLYDHHSRNIQQKANYISYCQVMGMTAGKPSSKRYTVPTEVSPTQLTYATLTTTLTSINTELDSLYNSLFVNNPHFTQYDMFWNRPMSILNEAGLYKEYNEKFFFFARQRLGNILIVRGKNVTLYYGEIEELKRTTDPKGSLHPSGSFDIKFAKSRQIVSGDAEQTVVFHFSSIDDLPYGQYYYLQGESVVYAAEFYEEPS